MAEQNAKPETQEKTVGLNIQLAPVDNSDQPVLANFTTLHGSPASMKTEASRSLKCLYCLTLIAGIFPSGLFGAAGWVGLATGGGLFRGGIVGVAILLAVFIYRIVLVVRNPHTLDAYVTSTPVRLLRNLGIFLMVIGLIGSFAIFFSTPLALGFVMDIMIYLISSAGLSGLLMFEASRLFGFEARLKEE